MSASASGKPLRVVYLAGPGDAPAVLRAMAAGQAYGDIAHVAYSGLVFEACRRLGAEMLSISTHARADDFSFGALRAVNVPDPLKGKAGVSYHLGNIAYARLVKRRVREFGANALITAPEPYPFLIAGLAREGVSLVPALHATLLPQFKRPSRARALAVFLSRRFYAKTCAAILSHPGWTVQQVLQLTRGHSRPIIEFLPLLRADAFPGVSAPQVDAPTFRVMTVGRVEADKGIFDLIEVARRCRERLGSGIRFDVCGAGSALDAARRRVAEIGLQDGMALHGWTTMPEMVRLWSESHVAVVPTTSDFVEGFNQVVIEAVLAARPVITSRVCPSLEYVRPCAIEVDVNDINGYVDAVIGLAADRQKYARLQHSTRAVITPFLDPARSFGTAVEHVLRAIAAQREATPVSHPPAF